MKLPPAPVAYLARWEVNQFRLILHMAAYWLLHA